MTLLLLVTSFLFFWESLPLLLLLVFSILLSEFNSLSFQLVQWSTLTSFDQVSLLITFITIVVIYCSCFWVSASLASSVTLVVLTLSCLGVFIASSVFLIYLSYEISLLPILYIILKWGTYPERSLSSVMLLVYTVVFTLPFIYILSLLITLNCSTVISHTPSNSLSVIASLVVFLCFSVNLPIYGLHFWLPIAHVEAPTFGSIILAGVLLKLGGVGLIRVLPLAQVSSLTSILLSYCIVFLSLVTLICCNQSDINRLVAYSSVSHIIALPPLLLLITDLSTSACTVLMLLHGLSSPLLFILVGISYQSFSTRNLIYLRGILTLSPLVSFISVMAFLFSLSAPPFPSFISEVMFLICSLHLSHFFLFSLLLFCMLSLVYSLNWLASLLFSPAPASNFIYFSFQSFLPILMTILLCPLFILIIASI